MSNADHLREPNPWHPITAPVDLKHLGKLNEECGELVAAAACCRMQGIAATMPWLEDEIADVRANIDLCVDHFALGRVEIAMRVLRTKLHAVRTDHLNELNRACGGLVSASSRCLIQGVDEAEPVTGRVNRNWLENAAADVRAWIELCEEHFSLDCARITARASKKKLHLQKWHAQA